MDASTLADLLISDLSCMQLEEWRLCFRMLGQRHRCSQRDAIAPDVIVLFAIDEPIIGNINRQLALPEELRTNQAFVNQLTFQGDFRFE